MRREADAEEHDFSRRQGIQNTENGIAAKAFGNAAGIEGIKSMDMLV